MTDKQPEVLQQAAWLKNEGASCHRHYDLGVLIERQHGELEALRAKLKTHEDLGDAGSDVQLLRMGYAAARLEIESLKAQLVERAKEHADELTVAYMCGASREKELAAQQTGAAYATRPDEREAFEAMMRSQTFDSLKRLSDGSYESYEARVGWLAWNVRASQGQAPAGATEPTEQQILEAAFAPAQPAVEASRFGGPELQAMIIARCVEKDLAESVLEDAADPLQGAANWLAEAHGQFSSVVLSGCLMIGYNRAKRLHDAAIAAKQGGAA